MFLEVAEVEIMGGLMTFDVVTGYGLICALVFMTGFFVATYYEKRRGAKVVAHKT